MDIKLERIDNAFRMEASNSRRDLLYCDGSAKIGGSEQGWRPMELLLVSLAGCSSIDVINILRKQRQDIENMTVSISGQRKEGIPSPYESIDVHFEMTGNIRDSKLEKALELTKNKYCSVYFSLHPDILVKYTYSINKVSST